MEMELLKAKLSALSFADLQALQQLTEKYYASILNDAFDSVDVKAIENERDTLIKVIEEVALKNVASFLEIN